MFFYFSVLLIYLHLTGCLHFYICENTYKQSSTRIATMDGLGMRQVDPEDPSKYVYLFEEVKGYYEEAE